jgi:eukaryotic-like serine/threonine-protein kinase
MMNTAPQRLGPYELHKRLARGGMGEVWKAFDPHLRRYVAIKLLLADLRNDPDFVTRFGREAQLVASLRHPNIVPVHDFDVAPHPETGITTAYMVMDYIPGGQTLADCIRTTARKGQFLSAAQLVRLFATVGRAIDYAHEQGVVHRDIKPANILLDQRQHRLSAASPFGDPVLTDFGIARAQSASGGTALGMLLGTPRYMAPEQARGLPGDARSDLYSLGIILYELTTGVLPFRGETMAALLMQHVHDLPTPPALINPSISPALSALILKSIEKDPAARFPSASAMAHALAEALKVPGATGPFQPAALSDEAHTPLSAHPPPSNPGGWMTPSSPPVAVPPPRGDGEPFDSRKDSDASPAYYAPSPSATSEAALEALRQQGLLSPAGVAVPSLPIPSSPSASASVRPRRHRFIVLIALLIMALTAVGWSISALLVHVSSNAGVGHVTFFRSPQTPSGTFDEVQIDLNNLPAPDPETYYAWLQSPCTDSDRGAGPHWRLPFSQGKIHTAPLSSQGFCASPHSLLLITKESADVPPIVPSARLYYAQIPQTASSTFEVLPCPPSNSSMVCTAG